MFYLTKVLRLYQGFKILDVQKILSIVKKRYRQNFQTFVDRNPELASNTLIDNNKIGQLLYIKYFIKISKFVIVIVNISFIVGMCWHILCKFVEDFVHGAEYKGLFANEVNFIVESVGLDNHLLYQYTFLVKYDFQQMKTWEAQLITTYFAFTSLSTVGFGDYVPQSDTERLIGAFILLFGVLIFSNIMNQFIDLIHEFRVYDAPINHGHDLTKFFSLIKYFNYGKHLNDGVKERIEAHLNF